MKKARLFSLLVLAVIAILVVVGCQPQTEEVEVTRVVTETEEVEVTRVIT